MAEIVCILGAAIRHDLSVGTRVKTVEGYAYTHDPTCERSHVKSAFSLKSVQFLAVLTVGAGLLVTDGSFLSRYLAVAGQWQHANVWVPICHVQVK
jgi:hypothetical protein